MKNLRSQLDSIEELIVSKEEINLSVSGASVGWHLDHMLRVINSISSALQKSNPKDYTYKFNFWRLVIFTTTHIPRGKAKSPKQVVPDEVISENDIKERIVAARENIKNIEKLPKKSSFNHPYFGQLKRNQSIRFIQMHTKHHLKIITDILKSN